jgi:glyoxylase-like metal-dependent hydrolase (beta-lactamase superfamily II)
MNVTCLPVGPLQANCYLVSDDHGTACAVDPGGEPERLAAFVADRGLSLTHIFLTHGHFDHLVGTAGLASATGATVACAAATVPGLRDPGRHMLFPGFGDPEGWEADLILEDGDVIPVGQLRVTVISTPGHSPGDITLEIGGELFCGDLLFRRSVGRTDLPGGDMNLLLGSVRRLADRYPQTTVVHPGHMDATTLGEELAFNPFLVGLPGRG